MRTVPKSRHNPQFESTALARWLPEHEIAYQWCQALGGFRKPHPDSRNTFWKHPSFRGYADYMETPEFRDALAQLIEKSQDGTTALMCSESVWWRCHRRLVADALLARGVPVMHLSHRGEQTPHTLTPGARILGDIVRYDKHA